MLLCLFLIYIFIKIFIYIFSPTVKKSTSKTLAPLNYKLFYSDTTPAIKQKNVIYSKLLYSEKYNIQGKPDYIFKNGKSHLPIELKSGKAKSNPYPYEGDLFQLVAYFLIIEDIYKSRPKYGKIVYSDCTFIVKNKYSLRRLLLKKLKKMRLLLKTGQATPNKDFQKCKNCLCKLTVCEYYQNKT